METRRTRIKTRSGIQKNTRVISTTSRRTSRTKVNPRTSNKRNKVVKKKLRLKKKPVIILLLLLLTPGLIIFMNSKPKTEFKKTNENTSINANKNTNTTNNNSTKKSTTTTTTKDELPYYKIENKARYEAYQKKHKNLSHEDVVTRVNIGLDYEQYTHTKKTNNLDTTYVLVNKYNYLSKDYVPKNLEKINDNYSNGNKKLAHEARIAFEELAKNAKKDNINVRAISTYRSYNYQNQLYNNYVASSGVKEANRFSAKPGFSEHQTGLAIDCDNKVSFFENFEKTESFKWMMQNAHKYGFILRYPKDKEHITGYKYESWHYRYVGVEIASYIKKNNITFDEYYVRFIER